MPGSAAARHAVPVPTAGPLPGGVRASAAGKVASHCKGSFWEADVVVVGSSCASDIIRTIRDPEKPNTLEELDVVTESCVQVDEIGEEEYLVVIRFTPTVPHCSLATLIGNVCFIKSLAVNVKLILECLNSIPLS